VNPSWGGWFYVFILTLSLFGVRAWFSVKEIRILFCLRFLSVECMNKRIFYVDMKLITCIALLSKENKKGSSKLASTQHITSHQKVNVSWITERCSYILLCSIVAMVPHQIALMTSKVMNEHQIQNKMHCIWFPCLACMVQYILHNLSLLRNFLVPQLSIRRFSQIWL